MVAAGPGINGSVDTDQIAMYINQRAAGVPGIDRGVSLNEIFKCVDAKVRAAEGRNDAHRDCLADAERIADG